MRKEVIIAIILGFALGLVITFGIWKANKALRKEEVVEEPVVVATITPKPTPTPEFALEIFSPEDEGISSKDTVTITGKTLPGWVVAVIYEKGEEIVETDSAGNFEIEVGLISGTNEIEIVAFGPDGEEATQKLAIVYSTAEI